MDLHSKASSRLNLRDVTVCAVDCLNPSLAANALARSAQCCDFADVILFTDVALPDSPDIRVEKIDHIGSRQEYSRFVLKELHRRIATPHMLIVQWDGFVANANAWRPQFLDYDYIGPRWPWFQAPYDVGNGGFSLRSTRLMHLTAELDVTLPADLNEDLAICHALRPKLEAEYGIRFAPAEIADGFAHEYVQPESPVFGFHGAFNLWRYLSDNEVIELVRAMDARTFASSELFLLLYDYYVQNNIDCMRVLYSRFMETQGRERVLKKLAEANLPLDLMTACLDACERIA